MYIYIYIQKDIYIYIYMYIVFSDAIYIYICIQAARTGDPLPEVRLAFRAERGRANSSVRFGSARFGRIPSIPPFGLVRFGSEECIFPVRWGSACASDLGRGDDPVGNPHRAQMSQLELFELPIFLKVDQLFPVERFEATVSQSREPSPPLINTAWQWVLCVCLLACLPAMLRPPDTMKLYNINNHVMYM